MENKARSMFEKNEFKLTKIQLQMSKKLTKQILKVINRFSEDFEFNVDDKYVKRMQLPMHQKYLKNILSEERKFPYQKLEEFWSIFLRETEILETFFQYQKDFIHNLDKEGKAIEIKKDVNF